MFIRSVKVKSSSGCVHEYVRIVSTVRESGKVKQKVVANLGRRDTLEAVLPLLQRFLQGEPDLAEQLGQQGPIEILDASTWGPTLAVRFLFAQLGLWRILDQCDARQPPHLRSTHEDNDDWISRVMALVANRLTRPTSEHGLARWLETDFVCDRHGRRYVPDWQQHQRVQVSFAQLQRWYRALDHLIAHKSDIEVALFHRLRDLFDFQPELVFYDLTSTYFEGHGPVDFAKHGYSRDGKPRCVQVVVGMVMIAGWPIAHHVWAGNTKDSTTVQEVVDDLSQRFPFRRVVFVGDRGMVSEKNLERLQKKQPEEDLELGFVLGMTRRRNPEAEALIDRVREEAWIECPGGINAQEKKPSPRTRVQEVSCDREGVRVFVVDSDERRGYEQAMRQKSMSRAKEALEKVCQRVASGKLKSPEKIGAAVERALKKHHGHRYFAWELTDGKLRYFEHPVNFPREQKYEGKYLIQTDQADLTPQEAVAQYKQLNEVERGFRSLKDPISMRPIHHRAEDRVRGHIFVAALAFLLERVLERRLKEAGVDLSAQQALQALETIRHVTFDVEGEQRIGITPGSARARQAVKALGLTQLRPPAPPEGDATVM